MGVLGLYVMVWLVWLVLVLVLMLCGFVGVIDVEIRPGCIFFWFALCGIYIFFSK